MAARDGDGADEAGRARPARPQPLSAQLLRRPAPAHRYRPGPGAAADDVDLRRAGVGTGRVDPGAGPEPAQGTEGPARPDIPVHPATPPAIGRASGRERRGPYVKI